MMQTACQTGNALIQNRISVRLWTTCPAGVKFSDMLQMIGSSDTSFDEPCLQPLVDHPSVHTVRDSFVEECAQVGVRDCVEVLSYIDVQHPVESPAPDGAA
jgi:hypothetical protein